MRKSLVLILLFAFCSYGSDSTIDESTQSSASSNIKELVYEDTTGTMVNVDLTNKKTLVVFWADYWGICREELPLLEANLTTISENYNVIALAHSDKDSTMTWVTENLVGELEIGFSTPELRDNLKIIGQPISLIFDTDGTILLREYGYVPSLSLIHIWRCRRRG